MLGTESSLRAAVQHTVANPTTMMSLLLDQPGGEYIVANGHGLPGLITIDPWFSNCVNNCRSVTGGIEEEYMPMIVKHVELFEEFYSPYMNEVDYDAVP